jgi:O-antigen/teichoic acid export membrane protein
MFRYAAEPFYFNYYKRSDDKEVFSRIMRLFIAVMLSICMVIMFYLRYVKYFIDVKFHEGLKIVPVILVAYVFYGIFFNLSVWYKLKKKTVYGAILTITGALITIMINVLFVKRFSYMASAAGHVVAYFVMVIMSYFLGRKYFRIDYKPGKIAEYIIIALSIFAFSEFVVGDLFIISDVINGLLIAGYLIYVMKRENIVLLKRLINEH